MNQRILWKRLLVPCMLSAALLLSALFVQAQTARHIPLDEAIRLGLANSKQLKLSRARIDEAATRYQQALDKRLPAIKVSGMVSEAYLPTHKVQLKGLMDEPAYLPRTSMVSLGTLSVSEAIFAGNKLRYAKESAELLKKIAELSAEDDRQEILLDIVNAYINLYKIDESRKIVSQNLQDIQGRLEETQKFEQQGLATLNDVLRFRLQKANVQLTQIDLENNREVANYALGVMLGLPDSTVIMVDSIAPANNRIQPLEDYLQQALNNRKDLTTYRYRDQLADVNIKDINAGKLPVLGVGLNTYYINPNKQFFPPAHSFLVPVTLGLDLSWNIANLYTSKHKVAEARVQQEEVRIGKEALADNIRIAVNKNYRTYLQALEKIRVLQTAVAQAKENDRIMEAKFRNQLATTTDRIDAQTLMYQSRINLELARADAEIAYYNLLQSTGTIQQ